MKEHRNCSIVIMHPEKAFRENFAAFLQREGFEACALSPASDLKKMLLQNPPELLVLPVPSPENPQLPLLVSPPNRGKRSVSLVLLAEPWEIPRALELFARRVTDILPLPLELGKPLAVRLSRDLEQSRDREEERRYRSFLEELLEEENRKNLSAQENLLYHKRTDPLTKLPNRTAFLEHLEETLEFTRQENSSCALVLCDLDNFVNVNAFHGHDVGDLLLQEVAQKLRKSYHSKNIARIGGDEFAFLLPRATEKIFLFQQIEEIRRSLAAPFTVQGQRLYLSMSYGVSLFPGDGKNANTLFKNAELALHTAKSRGRNRVHLFSSTLRDEANQYLEIESSLRDGLEGEEFTLYYQPILHCASRKTINLEALIRWFPPFSKKPVPPMHFIPHAEASGFIVPLGEWILRQACTQAKAWQDQGFVLDISVNLSAKQFQHPDLLPTVRRVLEQTGLPPETLTLELTENILIQSINEALEIMKALHGLGISLSIDDFGTGYSSMAYLKQFPVTWLKIDRSFVSGLPSSESDVAIGRSILSLARAMGMKVVAEGVETPDQARFLEEEGCDTYQGYYFSRPLPPGKLYAYLREEHSRTPGP